MRSLSVRILWKNCNSCAAWVLSLGSWVQQLDKPFSWLRHSFSLRCAKLQWFEKKLHSRFPDDPGPHQKWNWSMRHKRYRGCFRIHHISMLRRLFCDSRKLTCASECCCPRLSSDLSQQYNVLPSALFCLRLSWSKFAALQHTPFRSLHDPDTTP